MRDIVGRGTLETNERQHRWTVFLEGDVFKYACSCASSARAEGLSDHIRAVMNIEGLALVKEKQTA